MNKPHFGKLVGCLFEKNKKRVRALEAFLFSTSLFWGNDGEMVSEIYKGKGILFGNG